MHERTAPIASSSDGDTRSWIEPATAGGDDSHPLSDEQVAAWRIHGAVVVDGLVPIELVRAARAAAADTFAASNVADFGSGGRFVFPSDVTALNEITLHPRLLHGVAQLLGCGVRSLRLTQSDLWAKQGRTANPDDPFDNADQRIHVDYPNHSLTHPPPWDEPDAVEMIIYADDVRLCDGATAVVRRTGDGDPAYPWPIVDTPGVGGLPWINDRASAELLLADLAPDVERFRAEHLYAREQHVRYRPGTVLLYRHDTWHRGTPIRPGVMRVVQNLTFRKAASEWIGTIHEGWAWSMYRPTGTMERLVATSSVDQRCVLGIPAPGHPSWTAAMIDAMEARYGPHGIDMTEYRAANG